METADGIAFLAGLPRFVEFEGIADFSRYRPLPGGWALALADIVDSTGAIAAGRYKNVNMSGASVITAIVNALGRPDLPFVFGGDGAFLAVPPAGIGAARAALSRVGRWAEAEFGLKMRTALVPVDEIRAAGLDVRVARFQASDDVSYAMFAGGGASWAEARMKEGHYAAGAGDGGPPDLAGLSCRWDPIPARHGKILSVIAVPGPQGADESFQRLLADVVAIAAGEERGGHPVPAAGPGLSLSLRGVDGAPLTRPGRVGRLASRLGIAALTALLIFLRRYGLKLGRFDVRDYARDVSRNTDFRKFDDALKMTLDVDAARLEAIEERLAEAERAGICHFGLHLQDEALMTCIVPSPMSRDHMHFVDGAAGGYAEAASRLKEKLRAGV
ncbi:MAG: DUF3095 domain-containing protein [Proteobacteria bacterium]|nr:DUF3095 domain-containing protein [Pseudomonadota bacterium]MBS0572107.1 DUF3095 domain-containing protein [Pseudomonadota bacterium]